MKLNPAPSPIVRLACRTLARLIQVFGLYVIFHGHDAPGGGFQGGALFASAVILLRIGEGADATQRDMPMRAALTLGAFGIFVCIALGAVAAFAGGHFLGYSHLPVPGMSRVDLHYWGIFVFEIGVGLTVMAVLVTIFDQLMEKVADD